MSTTRGIAPERPGKSWDPDERLVFERLMASGILERSPNLALILNYVCSKYFEDRTGEIKEYNIAVEALGRGPEFDKKRDSIVRVEAHRLRKRLLQYFATTGKDEPYEIAIPEGSYVPEFRPRTNAVIEPSTVPEVLPPREAPAVVTDSQARHPRALAALALLLLVGVIVASFVALRRAPAEVNTPPTKSADAPAPPAAPPGEEIRILAGRGPSRYIDRYGQTWDGDAFFAGGSANVTRHQAIQGLDQNLFAGMREGTFRYDIPVKPGVYELHLIFAETEYGEANAFGGNEQSRSFDVRLNGQPLLGGFDVVSDAGGPNMATVKIFKDVEPARDGMIHLEFDGGLMGRAFVNAIKVLPGIRGRMRPIRMVARVQPYRDPGGNIWLPDHFVNAGTVIGRPTLPFNYPDAELYRGERYGNFTYFIPVVSKGKYAVTLHFNEFWFGESSPGKGGIGSRIFRVFCNHKPLLDNFDLLRETGGKPMTPLVKTFRNLEPNAQSKLLLHFEPIENFALLNAIEVVDESGR